MVVEQDGCCVTWCRGGVISRGGCVLTRCGGGGKGWWWWKGMGAVWRHNVASWQGRFAWWLCLDGS